MQGISLSCGHRFRRVAIIIPFSAVSPIQYTEGSHRAVEITLGGFFAARKTERRFSLWHSKSRRSSEQKSMSLYAKLAVIAIRKTVCCWMTLKCSAEPKCRDVAQIAVFSAEAEPFWLRNKMYPQGQESGLRHRAAQKCAEISVSDSRFSLCPAGGVLWYSKQGLCVPQKSQSQPKTVPPDALFACLEKLGKLADKASSPELDKEIYTVLKQITAEFLLPGKG